MIGTKKPKADALPLASDIARWIVDGAHGHVMGRDDGCRARCGGPAICKRCKLEQEILDAKFRGVA